MTDNNHPITPPPELFAEWFTNSLKTLDRTVSKDDRGTTGLIAGEVAIQAAHWGADQELEACCEWFIGDWTDIETADKLRAARRPKPPSLKELALQVLANADGADHPVVVTVLTADQHALIRRALESLPD